jgi:penicillin-binding protein 1C
MFFQRSTMSASYLAPFRFAMSRRYKQGIDLWKLNPLEQSTSGQPTLRPISIVLSIFFATMLLVGCDDIGAYPGAYALPGSTIDSRVAEQTMAVVEEYLQTYQPGPTPRLFQTTRLTDRNGVLIAELMGEGRRTWIPLDQVSPFLIQATIATEDASYYENNGIDVWRIAGALLRNIQSGTVVSGASTITMQLARNLFVAPEKRDEETVDRKLLEAGIAQELTDLYSKDEILEMYLNLLNYGQLTYGPEAAAQVYFGKSAADLTLGEASMMAGLPQQPAYLNPYLDYEAARFRQRIVLDLMVRHGFLSDSEADAAYAEPIALAGDPGLAPNLAPHFVQYVVETLDSQFGEGYTRRSGLNITTTLDLAIQQMAQETVVENVEKLLPTYGLSNAALVAMMPYSGEILAMVGSADFDDPTISGQVNVALRERQPGSAIKPVLYATAIEQNAISPATVIWDTKVQYNADGGQSYAPRNYDRLFHGPVSVRTALASSYNIPAVKLLDAVGVETMLAGAKRLGINGLDRGTDWYGLSLALGGGEVTLLDLTTAYHTLASDGQYLPPNPILSLVDNMGNEIEQIEAEPRVVISPGTAFLVSDMLSDNRARQPGFGLNSPLNLDVPAAVKTGTTTDFRDNWTLGYTRYLVAGVWAGNSDGTPMRNATGVTGAAPIWRDFMTKVQASPPALAILNASSDPDAWQFVPPEGVVQENRCPPGVTCREGGEYFRTSWLESAQSRGGADPLFDSVALVKSAPVYMTEGEAARLVGYCAIDEASERYLLSVNSIAGLSTLIGTRPITDESEVQSAFVAALADAFRETVQGDKPDAETETEPGASPNDGDPIGVGPTGGDEMSDDVIRESRLWTNEHLGALAWSLQYGAPVNLGNCDELAGRIGEAFERWPASDLGGQRVLVDLGAAYSDDVGRLGETVALSALVGAVDVASVIGTGSEQDLDAGQYVLTQPVVHNDACPGSYIMGTILNAAGGPVPGVTVTARDEWGNTAQAVSKSGAADFGRFDLPVHSGTPHTIYVTVLDGSGNAISPTVAVEHNKGEEGTGPCHHVVFQDRGLGVERVGQSAEHGPDGGG